MMENKPNLSVKAKGTGRKDETNGGLRKKRNGVMMRGKDRGRVICTLLRLTDKEAMVFMPLREQKISGRQDEKKRGMRCEESRKGLVVSSLVSR